MHSHFLIFLYISCKDVELNPRVEYPNMPTKLSQNSDFKKTLSIFMVQYKLRHDQTIAFWFLIRKYLGAISDPCCMSDPQLCHKQLCKLQSNSYSSVSSLQGCGLSHSYGESLQTYVRSSDLSRSNCDR